MFDIGDKVRIKETGSIGTITDRYDGWGYAQFDILLDNGETVVCYHTDIEEI